MFCYILNILKEDKERAIVEPSCLVLHDIKRI